MMMPFLLMLAGLGMPAAAAAAPTPAAPVPSVAQAPVRGPTAEELAQSAAAVGAADTSRMLTDAAYAAEILRHLDRLAPTLSGDADASLALDNLRLAALVGLERRAEAEAVADSILARRPADPGDYFGPWAAARSFNDPARALAVIETASRFVPGAARPGLRAMLGEESVLAVFGRLDEEDDRALRLRLAEALLRIGWPSDDDGLADELRTLLIRDRLGHGDQAGAASVAATIATPIGLVPLLVDKRYDSLFPANVDRLALLRRALAARERGTAAALAAAPGDMRRLVDRAWHLRSLGRDADALAVLAPAIRNVAAAAGDENAMWAVDHAAYTLVALGRDGEALRLMEAVAALPLDGHGHLASTRINHLLILSWIGRHAEVLDRADRLEAESGFEASGYARAYIASVRICALAALSRAAEAPPLLARLRGWSETNAVALSHALLCLGDLDAAAALLVERLGREDPGPALLALQDYRLYRVSNERGVLRARFLSLRARPEVRAALDRVGRVLSLPLSLTYWNGL